MEYKKLFAENVKMKKKIWIFIVSLLILSSICKESLAYAWTGNIVQNYTNNVMPGSLDASLTLKVVGDITIITSPDDDAFSIWNTSDSSVWVLLYNTTISSGSSSLDGAAGIDVLGNIMAIISNVDDIITLWDISDWSAPTLYGYWNASANPCSVDGGYEVKLENRSGSLLAHATARSDDVYSIINMTGGGLGRCVFNWTASSGSECSIDNAFGLSINPNNYLTYVCANTGDMGSVINTSNLAALTCKYNFTDIDRPYSIDGCLYQSLPESLNYNYWFIAGSDDNEISIYNVTGGMNPVGVGNYSVGSSGAEVNCTVYSLGITSFDVSTDGKTLVSGPRSQFQTFRKVTVLNISGANIIQPVCIGNYNANAVTPEFNYTHYFWNDKDVIVLSSNRDSMFVFNGTDLYPDVGDSCACPIPATNWVINLTHHCNITSNCDITGFNLTLTGGTESDYLSFNSTITFCRLRFNATGTGWIYPNTILNGGKC